MVVLPLIILLTSRLSVEPALFLAARLTSPRRDMTALWRSHVEALSALRQQSTQRPDLQRWMVFLKLAFCKLFLIRLRKEPVEDIDISLQGWTDHATNRELDGATQSERCLKVKPLSLTPSKMHLLPTNQPLLSSNQPLQRLTRRQETQLIWFPAALSHVTSLRRHKTFSKRTSAYLYR